MLHLFSTNVALRQALVNLSKDMIQKNGFNPHNADLIREIKSYLTAKSQTVVFEKECRELDLLKKKLQEENEKLSEINQAKIKLRNELENEILEFSETVTSFQAEIEELEAKKAGLLEAQDLQISMQ